MSFNVWMTRKHPVWSGALSGTTTMLGVLLGVATDSLSIAIAASVGFASVAYATFYALYKREQRRLSP